ncbi:MAG TPA: hypothetical protein DCQ34_10730 [Chitinophagaceae bacterium]|nr:hypothetical protein [Chitinophagaceae bacterium]
MKDTKTILLLVVSVLLLLVSFALLWTWGYQFSSFTKDKAGTVYIIKDSTESANAKRDSLRRVYASTVAGFAKLDSAWNRADSLKTGLDIKLNEFYKLRDEITQLLKNPASQTDLESARLKINELQGRVESLRARNIEVEEENKKLMAMINQIRQQNNTQTNTSTASGGNSNALVTPVSNRSRPGVQAQQAPATIATETGTNLFASTDMRLSALMVDQGKEMETNDAFQTDKISGSFVVRNSSMPINSAEVYVVVIQPNGKVLQNSAWDAGTFMTKEGRKIYSCKLRFDYNKGEAKRLQFSLAGDRFEKGNYILQVYHQGTLIGRMVKPLS